MERDGLICVHPCSSAANIGFAFFSVRLMEKFGQSEKIALRERGLTLSHRSEFSFRGFVGALLRSCLRFLGLLSDDCHATSTDRITRIQLPDWLTTRLSARATSPACSTPSILRPCTSSSKRPLPPVFSKMCIRWTFPAPAVICRASAISLFFSPPHT